MNARLRNSAMIVIELSNSFGVEFLGLMGEVQVVWLHGTTVFE